MDIKVLRLNEQEAKALLELINMAIKAGGLPVAEAALILSTKINSAPLEGSGPEDSGGQESESAPKSK